MVLKAHPYIELEDLPPAPSSLTLLPLDTPFKDLKINTVTSAMLIFPSSTEPAVSSLLEALLAEVHSGRCST